MYSAYKLCCGSIEYYSKIMPSATVSQWPWRCAAELCVAREIPTCGGSDIPMGTECENACAMVHVSRPQGVKINLEPTITAFLITRN